MSEEKKPESEDEVLTSTEQAEAATEEVAGAGDDADELRVLLEEARAQAEERWSQVVRVQAELENTRRRAQQEVEKARQFGLEKFARELLPVKDSLELGLQAATGDDERVATLREGSELTLKMLKDVMEKFGIREVDPQGQRFDPELHQAMSIQPSGDHEPNTVMAVMQKGYTLNERLLRPAMVIVSQAPSGDSDGKSDEQA